MKILLQIASACLVMHMAFAAKGPVAEPVCDAVCPETYPIQDNWHLPYTNDCTKFCHCANDGNWKKDCPPGLHFNPTLQVCDWPERAGCEGGSPNEPASPPETTPKPAPGGCENVACLADDCFEYANSYDCQAYCDCDHGEISLKLCADGLHFNPKTGDCDFPTNANCTIPARGCEHVQCEAEDCFKTSNKLDCNAYCDCDHGKVSVGKCASGLHWNAATAACDFPENAHCDLETEVPAPTPGQPGGVCDDICPKVFPIVDNNHLPIPGVCTQFCHCANDGNWVKDCDAGLHFNAEKQVCDWPHDAGCVA